MKVVLIGVGNMGSAMVKAWLRAGTIDSSNLTLFDTDPAKVEVSHSANYNDEINGRISSADVVVLAIKPQDLAAASQRLSPLISSNTIILSILAGVTLERLSNAFPRTGKIVRAMPNMGARICQSMTGFVVAPGVSDQDKEKANKLLSGLGPVECLESEMLMDGWCAVVGSGPGFILAIMEGFVAAAIEQGFSAHLAEKMVSQTFYGTAFLARDAKLSLEELKNSVVSKGGTTAAGLEVFESGKVEETIKQMVKSATLRAKALNK